MDRPITTNPDALKAYLQARAAMRRGLIDEANTAITRALELDTTFAVAAVEAVTIRSWLQFSRGLPFSGMRELTALAMRHSDGLSERQRLRIEMYSASVNLKGARTAELAERMLQLDSADVDTWVLLGHTHLTNGWEYGATPDDAIAAIDNALALDSTHVPALAHAAYLSAWTGDPALMERRMALLRAVDTSQSIVRGSELALASLVRDDSAYSALADTIATQPVERWITVLRTLRAYRPARAELMLDRILARPGSGFPRRAATGARAQLWLGEGRVPEISQVLERGGFSEFASFENTVAGAIVATGLAGITDSTATPRALAAVEALVTPDSALRYYATRPVFWFGWVQAAWHATYGDTARARRWQGVFADFPPNENMPTYRDALREDIDARLAVRAGDLTGARRHAWNAFRSWGDHDSNELEFYPAPAMRFHLAQLLQAANLPDSAAMLYRSLMPPGTWMGSLGTRSALELGHIAENRGDRNDAALFYSQALRMWEQGGPNVEPWRSEAAAGIARTSGEKVTVRIPVRPRS